MTCKNLTHSLKEKGQGITEFALVVPVLLVIAFGLLDLGRAFFSVITISNAARVGARYLSMNSVDKDLAFEGTKQAAVQEAQGSFVNITPANVSVTCIDSDGNDMCDAGYPGVVTVTHQFNLVMGFFFPSPITLTRSAQMVVYW